MIFRMCIVMFRKLISLAYSLWRRSHIGLLVLCIGTMAACSKAPENQREVRFENSQKDMNELNSKIRLPERDLQLEDFLAYALNRNLDLMGLRMEYDIQQEVLTGQKLGMLPGLTYNAELSRRSHESGSTSKSLITGLQSNNPSTSSEQMTNRKDLSFAWSLVDFGVSYYRSRQEFSRGLILQERYKRLRQNLVLDVIQAYWKAVISQKAAKGAESIVNLAKERQESLKRQIESQTISEIQGLENEERLIEMQIRLQTFQSDLESAKSELASLLGLPPGVAFNIAEADLQDPKLPDLIIEDLEETALLSRPELYIQDLEKRVAADEVKAAMVSMFPNAQLFANGVYDRNKFLVQKTWYTMGARAAYDLLAIPRYKKLHKIAEQRLDMTERGRLSISVGVLAQVHLAYLAYLNTISQHALSNDLYSVKTRLLDAVKKGERLGQFGGAELLRLEAEALFAKVNAVTAYAEMQIALERVNNSIGKSLFYSHIKLADIDASPIGLFDLEEEKEEEKQEFIEAVPEEAIKDKEEEEELEAGLSIEKGGESLGTSAASDEESEKELIEEKEKRREELPEPSKVFSDYLRGWVRGYSADEEWEDVEPELGTATSDEEYEFYEEKLIKEEKEKQELPEPAKPEKEVEFVFRDTAKPRRASGDRLERDKLLDNAERSRLVRLRKLLDMIDVTTYKEEEKELVLERTIDLLNSQEIIAYLSEDDADEWATDAVLEQSERRYRFTNQMSKEQILESIDTDQSDIILDGELLAKLIEERPANDVVAREELRLALESDRIREFMRVKQIELAEEIKALEKEEKQTAIVPELEREEKPIFKEKTISVVKGITRGMKKLFEGFKNEPTDKKVAENELAVSRVESDKRRRVIQELSNEEIKQMLSEDAGDEEIEQDLESDIAAEALDLEVSLGMQVSELKEQRLAEILKKKTDLNNAAIEFENLLRLIVKDEAEADVVPVDIFGSAREERRAEAHVSEVYEISWLEDEEERVESIEIETSMNELALTYDDISDLVTEDNADESVSDALFEQSIAEGRFERSLPSIAPEEILEEKAEVDKAHSVSSSEERFEDALTEIIDLEEEKSELNERSVIERKGDSQFEERI